MDYKLKQMDASDNDPKEKRIEQVVRMSAKQENWGDIYDNIVKDATTLFNDRAEDIKKSSTKILKEQLDKQLKNIREGDQEGLRRLKVYIDDQKENYLFKNQLQCQAIVVRVFKRDIESANLIHQKN